MSDHQARSSLSPAEVSSLRSRYLEERNKRHKTSGIHQYAQASGAFGKFASDPWSDEAFERAPVDDDVNVLIVGCGFAGISAAARLRQAGVDDIRMIDRAADFGGVWYYNRYPGVQCDIESYCYMPLLEEVGYVPSEKYAHGPEILEHAQRLARHFSLYDDALLQTKVTEARWDEATCRWIVQTDRGDVLRARYLIQTIGVLDRPKLPGIPGIENFKGHAFHVSRWDFGYTGGHSRGDLTGLRDKRVAIVGTGASAVQCIPYLGEDAQHLYVIQRTPTTVGVRGNHPTDPEWAASLQPGWQKERLTNFISLTAGHQTDTDLVDDGWTDAVRALGGFFGGKELDATPEQAAERGEINDFVHMNRQRDRIDAIVGDPETAEALKPWYRFFCKRPTFNDRYYPTFNRDNVTLVDTGGMGPERITPTAIVAGGQEYAVDCIIFATGYELGTSIESRLGYPIVGVDGTDLSSVWTDGLRTFHGLATHGFPNLFQTGVSQNGVSYCTTHDLGVQAEHIAHIIAKLEERGVSRAEASADAEEQWVATIRDKGNETREFQDACTPGYYNFEGKREKGLFSPHEEAYGPGPFKFRELMQAWREEGSLAGFDLK